MESGEYTQSGDQYPVQFSVEYPDRDLDRLLTAFRIIVAIPILIVVGAIGGGWGDWSGGSGNGAWFAAGGGGVLFFPALLMIVFRQKYPRWWYDWNLELLRFQNRVGVYVGLMDDQYPSTDERQSVSLEFPYPDAKQGLKSVASARQVVSRDPSLHRADLPGSRGDRLRDHLLVRDPFHWSLSERPLRLRRRRPALGQSRHGLRFRPGDRPIPAFPAEPVTSGVRPLPFWTSLV